MKNLDEEAVDSFQEQKLNCGFVGGAFYVAHCSTCVCLTTYIRVSSPWLLFHQLHPPCFTLPAKQLHTHIVIHMSVL